MSKNLGGKFFWLTIEQVGRWMGVKGILRDCLVQCKNIL
jgi:hypothetical protein